MGHYGIVREREGEKKNPYERLFCLSEACELQVFFPTS